MESTLNVAEQTVLDAGAGYGIGHAGPAAQPNRADPPFPIPHYAPASAGSTPVPSNAA